MLFRDRHDAGRQLATGLSHYIGRRDVLVLALPRGGVPVGYEVAQALRAPLDVFLVRKLGLPGRRELALGAIASGGIRVLNRPALDALGVDPVELDAIAADEQRELERRERMYRGDRPAPDVRGRTVVLIDDGLATGSTMRAAIQALRQHNPARIVMAVPVGSSEICAELGSEADEAICARTPEPFHAVSLWYDDFSQTTDQEVCDLLARANSGGNDRATATAPNSEG